MGRFLLSVIRNILLFPVIILLAVLERIAFFAWIAFTYIGCTLSVVVLFASVVCWGGRHIDNSRLAEMLIIALMLFITPMISEAFLSGIEKVKDALQEFYL